MAKIEKQSCFCTVERGRTEETITVVGNRMILAVYTNTWGHLMLRVKLTPGHTNMSGLCCHPRLTDIHQLQLRVMFGS